MRPRLSKALILGLFAGMLGLIFTLTPFGFNLEENVGLGLLFGLRGKRQPPPDVVIVALDRKSAEKLNVPQEPRKWSRSLHARLTENLAKEEASVITFDLNFEEAKSADEDDLLAGAIDRAQNVVLCERLKREKVLLAEKTGENAGSIHVERLAPPIPLLAKSALALAPFPLPKVPVKVAQFWTFKTEAGDTPTLPLVAFQIYAMNVYQEFIQLLEKVRPSRAMELPGDKETMIINRGVENVMRDIRGMFEEDSSLGRRMLTELEYRGSQTDNPQTDNPQTDNPQTDNPQTDNPQTDNPKRIQILKSLIRMYGSPDSLYLNYYGPPGTIKTISYYQALRSRKESDPKVDGLDFKGKAVFVGLFEPFPSEQKDGFHTVFSDSSGLDISGVEIAATAFANLLEGRPVQPLPLWSHLLMVFLWGIVIGLVCYLCPTFIAGTGLIGLAALYLMVAVFLFKTTADWCPLAIPFMIQSPLIFLSAVVWKSMDANRELQNIRKALRYQLPEMAVEQIVKNVGDFKKEKQLVYGICLHTDAEKYTNVSETMDPEELSNFMNTYFEVLFKPVKESGGIVSDIVGDSMLALWVAERPDSSFRNQACQAAVEIAKALDRFNRSSDKMNLPTRIGIHSGYLLLGSVGAIDHYEYRPIGDIVNTAKRIEGLNKSLGTQILVSGDVIHELDGFLTREIGRFLLVGKTKPVSIHELICRRGESTEEQTIQCATFAKALEVFGDRSWDQAAEGFRQYLNAFGEDGPCAFYLELCKQYGENPPEEPWNGIIRTGKHNGG